MDLLDTLRKKLDALSGGEFIPGLRAVLLHIETAYKHYSRGQANNDDTAFTDAIYRTNQAFEGSIKEAYRVLAGKAPEQKTPYEIEQYLEKSEVFRSRVLSQLTHYRSEWRNPSAHDYKLDFDENEALLAIVNVSAFAILLLNQIVEHLAYEKSKAATELQKPALLASLEKITNRDLLDEVASLMVNFCSLNVPINPPQGTLRELQAYGAIHGFLASVAPHLLVATETRLIPNKPFRADLMVSHESEQVIIEIKTKLRVTHADLAKAIDQVDDYMQIGNIKNGILLFVPNLSRDLERVEITLGETSRRIIVICQSESKYLFKNLHLSIRESIQYLN